MAGIQAYGKAMIVLHLIDNRREFLEAAADLGTLACHRFQGDIDIRIFRTRQHFV